MSGATNTYDLLKQQVDSLQVDYERFSLDEIAKILGINVKEAEMVQSVELRVEDGFVEIVLNNTLSDAEKKRWLFGVVETLKS